MVILMMVMMIGWTGRATLGAKSLWSWNSRVQRPRGLPKTRRCCEEDDDDTGDGDDDRLDGKGIPGRDDEEQDDDDTDDDGYDDDDYDDYDYDYDDDRLDGEGNPGREVPVELELQGATAQRVA